MEKAKDVEEFITNEKTWTDELNELVQIVRQANLEETIKWRMPCYMAFGHNVLSVVAFKNYFGLWFHQGVFLKDEDGVLENAQEGKTKALRQWRMREMSDIKKEQIEDYIQEALLLAKEGTVLKAEKKELVMPVELSNALAESPELSVAFCELKKSQQREYADWVSSAKRDETKTRRIAKAIPMILAAEGLNDKYR